MPQQIMPTLDRKKLIKNSNKIHHEFDIYSFFQKEIADRMIARLEVIKFQPKMILDLGARTGYTSQLLKKKFPLAKVIAVDWSANLLKKVSKECTPICADVQYLPLSNQAFDMVISNLTAHWLEDYSKSFKEWRRLLKPEGLLLFTACGPDTFYELRTSFAAVDDYPHVHVFLDMHDIGDALLSAQFSEPVMEAEHLCFNYSSLDGLWKDLRKTGVTNALISQRPSLTGKRRWRRMLDEYKKFVSQEDEWPVTFEVIYGLGWVLRDHHKNQDGEVIVPLSQIKRRSL